MTRRALAVVLLAAVLPSCGEPEQPPPADGTTTPVVEDGNFVERVYERNFVFASLAGDSVFLVPWMLRTVERPDSVEREARAWLARGGVWDAFFAQAWSTPPTREPALPLPYGALRLLVRDGNAIDGILYEEGPRSLEVILDEVEASWTGPRGGSFELLTGSAYLADQRIEGRVLDMSRAATAGAAPGGDWALLLSGDSAAFVLTADAEYGGESDPVYRAWAETEDGELGWPEVRLDWARTEAFPPARRDVPVEWRVRSPDGLLEGELEALSAELEPGPGPGPLLPVLGLYEVTGRLSTAEGDFPVRGILVHQRR